MNGRNCGCDHFIPVRAAKDHSLNPFGALAGYGSLSFNGALEVPGSLICVGARESVGSLPPSGALKSLGSLALYGALLSSGSERPVRAANLMGVPAFARQDIRFWSVGAVVIAIRHGLIMR